MHTLFAYLSWGDQGWGDELFFGLIATLKISFWAYSFGLFFGVLGAAAKLSQNRALSFIATVYTTTVRSIPELLLILLLYHLLTSRLESLLYGWGLVARDFSINPFIVGTFALAFVSGAFLTEAFRAAYLAVPKGEIEAARSIGMGPRTLFLRIAMPLALRHALPGMGNIWLNTTKDSALISVLGGFRDILTISRQAGGNTHEYFFFYAIAALLFLTITLVSIFAISRLERYYKKGYI